MKSAVRLLGLFVMVISTAAAGERQRVAEVPMILWGASPAVEVMVNGQGPFRFVLDTGAGGTVVSEALAARLNFPVEGETQVSDGSGRRVTSKRVRVESVRVGPLEFNKLSANLGALAGPPGMDDPVDGILAFPLFREYLLTLDFPGAQVRIERGELPAPNGSERIAWRSVHGTPMILAWIGDLPMEVHLDTGNRGKMGLLLPEDVVSRLAKDGEPEPAGKARSVTGEFDVFTVRLRDTLRIGKHEFPSPTARYSSHGLRPNVGAALLHNFVVTLDQKNRVVELQRVAAVAER
jgi:hypothetical protein